MYAHLSPLLISVFASQEEEEEEEEEGEDWGEWEEKSKPSSSTAEKTTTPAPRYVPRPSPLLHSMHCTCTVYM